MYKKARILGRVFLQAVIRRYLTSGNRIRSRVIPYYFFKWHYDNEFLIQVLRLASLSAIQPMSHKQISKYTYSPSIFKLLLTRTDAQRSK